MMAKKAMAGMALAVLIVAGLGFPAAVLGLLTGGPGALLVVPVGILIWRHLRRDQPVRQRIAPPAAPRRVSELKLPTPQHPVLFVQEPIVAPVRPSYAGGKR